MPSSSAAGGVVAAGEEYLDAAHRAVAEALGASAASQDYPGQAPAAAETELAIAAIGGTIEVSPTPRTP